VKMDDGILLILILALVIFFLTTKEVPAKEVRVFLDRIKDYEGFIEEETSSSNISAYADTIRALIWRESSGNTNAERYEGEKWGWSTGLMQLLLTTAEQMGYKGDRNGLFNPATNIKYGVKYFAWQLNRYGYDERKSISAYNRGSYTPTNKAYVDKVLEYKEKIKEARE